MPRFVVVAPVATIEAGFGRLQVIRVLAVLRGSRPGRAANLRKPAGCLGGASDSSSGAADGKWKRTLHHNGLAPAARPGMDVTFERDGIRGSSLKEVHAPVESCDAHSGRRVGRTAAARRQDAVPPQAACA